MNPNGLTDEQTASRPKPFVGMIFHWDWAGRVAWDKITDENWAIWLEQKGSHVQDRFLLPGEPGCPWPPPEEFRHAFVEHDWGWMLIEGIWAKALVVARHGTIEVTADHPDNLGVCFAHIDTPAIYIPKVS